MIEVADLSGYLNYVLAESPILDLPNHYRGKVRDNYDLSDGTRVIIASDRLSAFDRAIACIPFKGMMLTQISKFWFEKTQSVCPNHVLAYPDPNVVICQRLQMTPVEVVVRGYLTGSTSTSIWPMYRSGKREFYGIRLPDGLRENDKLPNTVITPTTKALHGAHDEPITPADIVGRNLLSSRQWEEISEKSLALFSKGQAMAADRGLILVDTKYEFGISGDGSIVLGDELHTPDSSRYWFRDSYEDRKAQGQRPESFDKDYIRNWIAERCNPYAGDLPEIPSEIILNTARVYIDAFERITGQSFHLPTDLHIENRVRENLKRYFDSGADRARFA